MQVLATDMNKHMDHVAHLKTMVETRRISGCSKLSMDSYSDRIQVRSNKLHPVRVIPPRPTLLIGHLRMQSRDNVTMATPTQNRT